MNLPAGGGQVVLQTKEAGAPVRPPEVEREIAALVVLPDGEILQRARIVEPDEPGYIRSESLVHLVRRDLRGETRQLVDGLTQALLRRCELNMSRSVTGFKEPTRSQVREEILDRFILALLDPATEPDWFEVRFNRQFKFLRIDVCRRFQRGHLKPLDAEEPDEDEDGEAIDLLPSGGLSQEQGLLLKQALDLLPEEERKIFLLHRHLGLPISSKNEDDDTITKVMGLSERTVRYRLRSAEERFAALEEKKK